MLVYVWLAPVLVSGTWHHVALMIVVGLVIRSNSDSSFLALPAGRLDSLFSTRSAVWIFGTLLRVPMLSGPFGF